MEKKSEQWARGLARDTAMALGEDFCVVKGHPFEGEFMSYSRAYVENRLFCGEIGHGQVVAVYRGVDGVEIDREAVSEFRK